MTVYLSQTTKLALELTILFFAQTRCFTESLWLKTKLSFPTSTEALRRKGLFFRTVNIIFEMSQSVV